MEYKTLDVTTKATENDYTTFCSIASQGANGRLILFFLISACISIVTLENTETLVQMFLTSEWSKNLNLKAIKLITPLIYWFCLFLIGWVVFLFLNKYAGYKLTSPDGHFCAETKTEINQNCLLQTYEGYHSSITWNKIQKIENHADIIFFYIDKTMSYLVPKTGFEDEKAADDFCNQARIYWERAKNMDGKNPWGKETRAQKTEEDDALVS